MRKLKSNEKFIKEYPCFYLIEVACPNNNSYRDTIPKWEAREKVKEILPDGKKFTKTGYHKTVRETHPKRKKEKIK